MSKSLGKTLREAREGKGLTQKQVASHMNVTRAAVGQWEAGATEPTATKLLELGKYLDLSNISQSYNPKHRFSESDGHVTDISTGRIVDERIQKPVIGIVDLSTHIPILSTAEVFFDRDPEGDFVIHEDTYINIVSRPAGAKALNDIYGMFVATNKVEPRFYQGELIFIDYSHQALLRDYAVVFMNNVDDIKSGADRPVEPDDHRLAYIGRMAKRTANAVVLEQHNPSAKLELKSADIKRVARIVPWAELIAPR